MTFKNKRKNTKKDTKVPFSVYKDFFFGKDQGKNPEVYPNEDINVDEFLSKDSAFILLGHSTVLFRLDGKTFITDPVLREGRVGPLGIVGPKNFKY